MDCPQTEDPIAVINALKRNKAAGLDGLIAKLSIAASAASADLLFLLIHTS